MCSLFSLNLPVSAIAKVSKGNYYLSDFKFKAKSVLTLCSMDSNPGIFNSP